MTATPAGWYPDGQGNLRYWDGEQWTEHTAPDTSAAAAEAGGTDAAAAANTDAAGTDAAGTDAAAQAAASEQAAQLQAETVVQTQAVQQASDPAQQVQQQAAAFNGGGQGYSGGQAYGAQAGQQLMHLRFGFDGGAATYVGVAIAGFFVTALTLGICYPWAVVMVYRWQTKHTFINGQRLRFTGTAIGLFGHWVKWFLLSIITLGIYLFWVQPSLTKWIVEHQEVDPVQ